MVDAFWQSKGRDLFQRTMKKDTEIVRNPVVEPKGTQISSRTIQRALDPP